MIAIIGLGNPGEKYRNNRHNVGHLFVDYIKQEKPIDNQIKIFKTDCFMNQSGIFIKKLVRNLKLEISNLIVAHDDLDIPLGKFKIQKGTGPQLHNGIESVENSLKAKDFWRIRIGVDARTKENWIDGETYVLQNFKQEELQIIQSVFPEIIKRLQNNSPLRYNTLCKR
jgi:PTH1 family peptidyl-tRNA hydrolase